MKEDRNKYQALLRQARRSGRKADWDRVLAASGMAARLPPMPKGMPRGKKIVRARHNDKLGFCTSPLRTA